MNIYIHTYYTGKFNSVKHFKVYQDKNEAMAQKRVLGGSVIQCEVIKEIE